MIHNKNLKFDGSIDEFYNINQLISNLELLKANLKDFKIQTLNDFDEFKNIQNKIDKLNFEINKNRSENIKEIVEFDKFITNKMIEKIIERKDINQFNFLENIYINVQPEDLISSTGYIKFFNRYTALSFAKSVHSFNLLEDIQKDFNRFTLLNRFLNFLGLNYINIQKDYLFGRFKFDYDLSLENNREIIKDFKFEINIYFDDESFEFLLDIKNIEGKWSQNNNKISILGNENADITYKDLVNKKILFNFIFLNKEKSETFMSFMEIFYF